MTAKKKSGFREPGHLLPLAAIGGDIEGITRTALELRIELDKRKTQAQRARRNTGLKDPDAAIAYWYDCRTRGYTAGKADERTANKFDVSARTIGRERAKRGLRLKKGRSK